MENPIIVGKTIVVQIFPTLLQYLLKRAAYFDIMRKKGGNTNEK